MIMKLDEKENAEESVLDFPKDGLCPDVWEKTLDGRSWTLKEMVRQQLLAVFENLCDFGKLNHKHMSPRVVGSITSNQYGERSDVDLHIVMQEGHGIREFARMTQQRFVEAFERLKSEAPKLCHVGKYPIQVYYQPNPLQDLMSVGCYDIKARQWLTGPELKPAGYDPYKELLPDARKQVDVLVDDIRSAIMKAREDAELYLSAVEERSSAVLEFERQLKNSLFEAKHVWELAKQSRQALSSPESIEDVERLKNSRTWKIADAGFKLMDKFGYLAVLKRLSQLDGEPDTAKAAEETVKAVEEEF